MARSAGVGVVGPVVLAGPPVGFVLAQHERLLAVVRRHRGERAHWPSGEIKSFGEPKADDPGLFFVIVIDPGGPYHHHILLVGLFFFTRGVEEFLSRLYVES